MSVAIKFDEIPLFAELDQECHDKVRELFHPLLCKKEEYILKYGYDVPGIYVVVRGKVTVQTENLKMLAELGPGSSFGEMSLIERNMRASASVKATSDPLELMFCKKEQFMDLIRSDQEFANSFYKCVSSVLSSRLRSANRTVSEEIAKGMAYISKMIEENNIESKLMQTQQDLNTTGDSIVSKLVHVMPHLDDLQKNHDDISEKVEDLKGKLEDVFLIESQKFDRISQQMGLIMQIFENVYRAVNGAEQLGLRGDAFLFHKVDDNGDKAA